MGYVIAVCQSKGGSAKTTTAINLCGALIEKGFKAVVADMDRDKPDALNWAKQGNHIDFVMELFEEKPLDTVEHLQKKYDYIILDTPPNYMPAAFKAIMMADFVILPCSPSFLDQSNLVDAISIPRMAQKPFKILGCKIQKRQKLSEKLLSELIKSGQAFATSISNRAAVLESPFHGKWLGNYQPGCNSHKEFLSLAEEVIKIANIKVTAYPAFHAQKSSDNLEKRVSPV
ncbi:ParA family protein [Legionella shakespearei]|uniref:Sporulation initiation inhibitor protein Soj n=1 Tax=Legionella shakespearei DSM 23087 TaxID=1122169 RepID=A0A0W0YQ63_9GAMM|nr:ParA family protein [Legionella shakespearei]KTD59016.1 Sporulation initiation inhibitor protein Soj [Legionella shakespearei DSM 23087]